MYVSFSVYGVFRFSNQAEIARLLLSKGANVNLLNNSMCTALHIAVNKGFTDVVRVLTEHSADVNLQVRGSSMLNTADWPLIQIYCPTNHSKDFVVFHSFVSYYLTTLSDLD